MSTAMDTWLSHPATVHIPLALAVLMPAAFSMHWYGLEKKWFQRKSWMVIWSLGLVQLASGGLAYLTGERAKVLSAAEAELLAHHESFGLIFLSLAALQVFFFSLLFIETRPRMQVFIRLLNLIGLLVQAVVAIQLGKLGGQIVFG